jgi:Subtilase family
VEDLRHQLFHALTVLAIVFFVFSSFALEFRLTQVSKPQGEFYCVPLSVYSFANNYTGLYIPSQIKAAYGLPLTGGNGTTIAIIDAFQTPTISNDLTLFSSQFNLPLPTESNFEVHAMSDNISSTNVDWQVETCLDVEWAHAIAPEAKILLVEATTNAVSDLISAVDYAASLPDVLAVSMSWGSNESYYQLGYDSHLVSNGKVFFAASGDHGAGTIWPATSPNVVAVGGTTLNINSDGSVISETGWNGSGGGVSSLESMPQYQTNYGLNATQRCVPDVSYDADPTTGFFVVWNSKVEAVGGTSAGTPQWAAIYALNETATDANLYDRAKTDYSSYFRDIINGSNGYNATVGYDFITGLGSPLRCDFQPTPTPTPSPNPIPTDTPTPTPTPNPTVTPKPTPTLTPTPTPSITPSPSPTTNPTAKPTPTPTPIPTPTLTPTPNPTPTKTPTPSPTPTLTPTPTPSPTSTPTPTPTPTPTITPTPIQTPTPTPTTPPTPTPSSTPNPTQTPKPTITPEPTPIPNPTPTDTPTPSLTPTPTPTPTPEPTLTPTPTPTTTPTESPLPPTINPTQVPTATPLIKYIATPTPTPNTQTIEVTIDNNTTLDLPIWGNVTAQQISNVSLSASQTETSIYFTLTGQSGNWGFCNITIPKDAVSNGGTPTIYVDSQKAADQGYVQDNDNYYIWCTTHFSTQEVSIVFATLPSTSEYPVWAISSVLLIILGFSVTTLVIRHVRSKRKS